MRILVSVMALCLLTPRASRAADPVEESAARFFTFIVDAHVASLAAVEIGFLIGDARLAWRSTKSSLTRSATELAIHHFGLSAGAAMLMIGLDQKYDHFAAVGGGLMAASVPGAIHSMHALSGNGNATTFEGLQADRRTAGAVELGFAIPELAIDAIAFAASAAEPADRARNLGMATSALLAVPTTAMLMHGLYLRSSRVDSAPSRALVVPTVVGAAQHPTLGIGAVGRW